MFLAVARAAAIRGSLDSVAVAIKQARRLLNEEEEQSNAGSAWGSDALGSGGKRGRDKRIADEDDTKTVAARNRSLEVFQVHRKKELMAELRELETFAKKARSIDLTALWQRTLSFEDLLGNQDKSSKRGRREAAQEGTTAALLCKRLQESFGLKPEGKELVSVQSAFASALSAASQPSEQQPKKKRRLNDSGTTSASKLDLAALFPAKDAASGARAVHLELCSGNGEWLCAQALRDPSACWVACELRYDRAARCFQRFALQGLATPECNVGVIAGDARDALARRLKPASCTHLFINHPEPPHQTDLDTATATAEVSEPPKKSKSEQGDAGQPENSASRTADADTHLLTPSFLRDACAEVVCPGGTLTICTDSLEYGKWLLKTLAQPGFANLFEDALLGTKANKTLRLAKEGKVGLRAAPPPPKICGADYSGKAGASYFQRLKQSEKGSRGQEDHRYFICLRRLRETAA